MRAHLARLSFATAALSAVLGCGGSPPPRAASVDAAPSAPPAPAANGAPAPPAIFQSVASPACVLRGSGRIAGLSLRLGDKPIAKLRADDVEWAEVHAPAGAAKGSAVVRTRAFDVAGETDVTELDVTPREPRAKDGWLVVERFKVREVTAGGDIAGEVALPPLVTASAPLAITERCEDVALAPAPRADTRGTPRTLRPGASAKLRSAQGGPVVGELRVPENLDLRGRLVRVLEQRGAQARIALAGEGVTVEAWTDASALEPTNARTTALAVQADSMGLQMLASGGGGPPPRCARALTFYARDEGKVVAVGAIRPGAYVPLSRYAAQKGEELPIELDPQTGSAAGTFVLASAFAQCNAAPAPGEQIATAVPERGLTWAPADAPAAPAPGPGGVGLQGPRVVQGPRAAVVIGEITATKPVPGLDGAVAAMRARIRSCHQRELQHDPAMEGRLVVVVDVAPSGVVTRAQTRTNAGLSQAVATCAARVFAMSTFDPPNAPSTLEIPLTFSVEK